MFGRAGYGKKIVDKDMLTAMIYGQDESQNHPHFIPELKSNLKSYQHDGTDIRGCQGGCFN
jgi:hypothetical protein